MVNENNINKYVLENIQKTTSTVSYYDAETDQNLTFEEWRALNNNNSKVRVINQGESYRSWKANLDEPACGPSDLVSISGPGSSVTKLIMAADASSLAGEISGVKTCAAMHCWTQISNSEYYCSSHKNKVGEGVTNVAKSLDETANREGGLVVVSQQNLGESSKRTSVKYHSFR